MLRPVLLLLTKKQGATVEVLSLYKNWKGYTSDYEGSQKLVFSLKEPNSFLVKNNVMRISTEPRVSKKDWDFEIRGYFPDRDCSIVDTKGNIVAQVIDHVALKYVLFLAEDRDNSCQRFYIPIYVFFFFFLYVNLQMARAKKEVPEFMTSNDLYHVVVQPGIDQAFVFGVIAILDYIYGESTRC